MKENAIFTTQEVIDILGADVISHSSAQKAISGISTDSRTINNGQLFIPLIGEKFDAHKFVPDIVLQGKASMLLIEQKAVNDIKARIKNKIQDITLLGVSNTLKAYQLLAKNYLRKLPMKKIAITGSNGKTTTKELIKLLAGLKYNTRANSGNINNLIGVPQTAFEMDESIEIGVFEFGTGKPGDINQLADIVSPDYAVITNTGTAHIEFFHSEKAIASEKADIYRYLNTDGAAFIPESSKFINILSDSAGSREKYFFSFEEFENYNHEKFKINIMENLGHKGYTIQIEDKKFHFPIGGTYNLSNLSCALSVASILDISMDEAVSVLGNIRLPGMRSDIQKGRIDIFLDCYNANPDSMKSGLSFFSTLEAKSRKIAILGDMKELGKLSEKLHEEVGKHIEGLSDIDALITIGKDSMSISDSAGDSINKNHFESNEKALLFLQSYIKEGDFLYFKASRAMQLEDIAEKLKKIFS